MNQNIENFVLLFFLFSFYSCTHSTPNNTIIQNPLKGLKKGLWVPVNKDYIVNDVPYCVIGNDINYLTFLIDKSVFYDSKLRQIETKEWGVYSCFKEKLVQDSLKKNSLSANSYNFSNTDIITTNKKQNQLICIHEKDTIRYKHILEKSPLSLNDFWALDSLLKNTVWEEKVDIQKKQTLVFYNSPSKYQNKDLLYMFKQLIIFKFDNDTISTKEYKKLTLQYNQNIFFLFLEESYEKDPKMYIVEKINSTQWDLINIGLENKRLTWKKSNFISPYIKKSLAEQEEISAEISNNRR